MGRWLHKPFTERWLEPKIAYRNLKFRKLGSVEFVKVENDITVANVIGQVFHHNNGPPVRYHAISKALHIVAKISKRDNATVHMPRIGCGLGGGQWIEIEPILKHTLVNSGVHVNVYDLKN